MNPFKNHLIAHVVLAFALLVGMQNAIAAYSPSKIGRIDDYLKSSYFNANVNTNAYFTELTAFDFQGEWRYTAIAFESGNTNTVKPEGVPAGAGFSTADSSNFGEWYQVDFSLRDLFFGDSDGPVDVGLDNFIKANANFFTVFQLAADSNPLSYLTFDPQTILAAGTIIVGFNDNGLNGGDADFDDIIVALQPVPVPAAAILFGSGLLGLIGMRRRTTPKK